MSKHDITNKKVEGFLVVIIGLAAVIWGLSTLGVFTTTCFVSGPCPQPSANWLFTQKLALMAIILGAVIITLGILVIWLPKRKPILKSSIK